ncbi:MAG: DUF192 domain-containing protein [Eggerthellaceae bacterium]|nr:DUF192 domain-containing protein [Eggerthellaceae bacterium]
MSEAIEWACSRLLRLKGLIGRRPDGTLLVLCPCNDVHTWGMRHPLDMAFVAKDGRVVLSLRNVGPRQRKHAREAVLVVERFASPQQWFEEGEFVTLLPLKKEVYR